MPQLSIVIIDSDQKARTAIELAVGSKVILAGSAADLVSVEGESPIGHRLVFPFGSQAHEATRHLSYAIQSLQLGLDFRWDLLMEALSVPYSHSPSL